MSAPEADYNLLAAEALAKYLNNPDKIFTFFDVTVGEKSAGRIVFELYKSICPKTCENFAKLCTGEAGETEQGLELTYGPFVLRAPAWSNRLCPCQVQNVCISPCPE